jgi:hypothetical protein
VPESDEPIPNSIHAIFNDTSAMPNAMEYTSEGCSPGYGYAIAEENPICKPLAQTQGEKDNQTKSVIFCEALGCPYNPPSP